MKVVILAGGLGTRLSEETDARPKPMVEIGGKPILWHIMKLYSHYGFDDFVICLGYKGFLIKEYFANYFLHQSDVTIDLRNNRVENHGSSAEPWRITLVETGRDTMTGGRIKRIQKFINNESFMMTYGDGVSNVDINHLLSFHREHKKYVTVTAVQPEGKFGALDMSQDNIVKSFFEKPKGDGAWISGGFFVMEPEIFRFIKDDQTSWEKEPLERITMENNLAAYKHRGFWRPMDSLRDKRELEALWNNNKAQWKVWRD